ncbi:MAG: hypothetical protein BWY66_01180 [bacterium ADurb.Bin374]|nr:MAG: hypothetical protein BWY66_01180 [bacterium ADurb.Bin374]
MRVQVAFRYTGGFVSAETAEELAEAMLYASSFPVTVMVRFVTSIMGFPVATVRVVSQVFPEMFVRRVGVLVAPSILRSTDALPVSTPVTVALTVRTSPI